MNTQYKITILTVMFAAAYLCGIYPDEFTDIVFSTIFTGLFQTQSGTIFNNYECLFLISKLIPLVQNCFPFVNIYVLFLVVINLYCIYFISIQFYENTIAKHKNYLSCLIFIVIFLLLIHDFIFVQFTKTAVYCNATAIYLLLKNKGKFKTSLFLLSCGVFLRTETFWFVFIISLFISIILFRVSYLENIKNNKYRWILMITIITLISFLDKKIYNNDDLRYETFRTYKYTILDFNQDKNNKTLSIKDSVKYDALHHAFFGDTDSLINTKTFHQLNIKQHDRTDLKSFLVTVIKKKNITRAATILSALLYYNKAYYLAWLSVILVIIITITLSKEYKQLKKISITLLVLFAFIFLITIYIKMEDRVLTPVLVITLLYFLSNCSTFKRIKNGVNILLALLLLSSGLYFLSEYYYKVSHKKNMLRQSNEFISNWKMHYSDKILVPDIFSWQLFFPDAISSTNAIKNINLFTIDGAYLPLMKNHLDYMQKTVKSNSYKDYILYLKENKKDVYFIGSTERIKMIECYVQQIYQIDFHLEKTSSKAVVDAFATTGHLQLYLFKLE